MWYLIGIIIVWHDQGQMDGTPHDWSHMPLQTTQYTFKPLALAAHPGTRTLLKWYPSLRTSLKWGHCSNKDTFPFPKNRYLANTDTFFCPNCVRIRGVNRPHWNEDTALIRTPFLSPRTVIYLANTDHFFCPNCARIRGVNRPMGSTVHGLS